MICYKTKMNELPKNCLDCKCQWCGLPLKGNTHEAVVKKQYTTKRHKECPLVEVVTEND